MNSELHRQVLGPWLAIQLQSWAAFVFGPAQQLKRAGLYQPTTLGPPPRLSSLPPLGPALSRRFNGPVLLDHAPDGYDLVEGFDDCAEGYDFAVRPFSDPIRDELMSLMWPHLNPGSRVLDPSSGTGLLAVELAAELHAGEVVAADLSRRMVEKTAELAEAHGVTNMAFFQADVAALPDPLVGYFDAVMSCLSFHHYPDGEAAAATFRRALRPGGKAFIADGGPQWFVDLARDLSIMTDPGFVQHRTGEQFTELLLGAGFAEVHWVEALPGIGVTIASA